MLLLIFFEIGFKYLQLNTQIKKKYFTLNKTENNFFCTHSSRSLRIYLIIWKAIVKTLKNKSYLFSFRGLHTIILFNFIKNFVP